MFFPFGRRTPVTPAKRLPDADYYSLRSGANGEDKILRKAFPPLRRLKRTVRTQRPDGWVFSDRSDGESAWQPS
jgi:hypothetical protein